MDGLEHLRGTVQQTMPFSDAEWTAFAGIWQPFEARRKVVLTQAGAVERYVYFVLEGVQRAYYISDEGREATLVFTYPHSFAGVADSFLLQQPSRYFFETLTPGKFLRAEFGRLDQVMLQHHTVERLIRLAIADALRGTLERQIELQSFSAEKRFRILMQRSPHLLQMIPHKYLANYLGIDPTNFSKFLGSIRI